MGGTGNGWEVPGSTVAPSAPQPSGSGTGSGWEVPGGAVSAAAKPSGGGLFSSLSGDLGAAGHWIASKASIGGNTIKSIGTGLYDIGKTDVYAPWKNFLTTGHPYAHGVGDKIDKSTNQVLAGSIIGPVTAIRHPLRDPIGDVVQALPFAHGLASAGVGGVEAAGALRAGEGLGVASKALRDPTLLKTSRMVNEPDRESVSLSTSHNAARRIVQAGIDRTVNKALANDRAKGLLGHEGPVASYGRYRMGGTLAERARAGIRYHQALIANTRVAGRGVAQFAKSIKGSVEDPQLTAQAILHSLHDNVLPEHEAIFHEIQAQKGINPEQNAAWAQAFNDASRLKIVRLGEDNRVAVDESHPLAAPLAKADSALEKLGAYSENQLVTRGLREPSTLEDRNARMSQLVQRSKPLLDQEPQPLRDTRRQVASLQKKLDTAQQREQVYMEKQRGRIADVKTRIGGRSVELGSPHREAIVTLGHQLEAAQARVTSLEDRYGLNSPERRAAMQQGIAAREQIAEAAHKLFGDQAPHHLAQIEGFARQFARTHDVTPHEFYAQFLRSVETPGEIGGLSPDALAEIQAFHGFPQEKTEANLRTKTNPRTQKNGLPLNKTMLTKEGIHFAGKVTPEQWMQRVTSVLKTGAERDHAARWYEHFEPLFREAFPPEEADKIIRGFSVSQANASPSSGVASTLAALERINKGEEVGSIGSVVAANIEKALKGEHIDSKVAAKLSDFIDALRGESTRTWMGHKTEGGAPAPIDIWGLRDLGYWDNKIMSKGRGARLAKMHGVDVNKLAVDHPGSASGARYERAAEKYREITDHLNATRFDGRDDWTPAQVQALGWSAIQKFYGQVPEDLATAIAKGRTRSQGIIQRGYVARAVEESKQPDGGFTLHSDMTPDHPDEGFAVALAPYEQRVPAQDFTTKDLQSFVARHKALLQRDPTLRVGGWHNPKDGLVYLDISRIVPTREEALAFAREHGQLSVFDRASAARGDWGNAFPESGLSTVEADAIKNAARARYQAPETYQQVIRSVAEKELGRKPNALDLKYTEDKMHEAAQSRPEDPTSQAFLRLHDHAHEELQSRVPQPEELFQAAWGPHEFGPESPHPLAGAGKANLDDLEQANKLLSPAEETIRRGHADLQGLPTASGKFHANQDLQGIAHSYMRDAKLEYNPPRTYAKVDPERASRIAHWYEQEQHAPNDPAVMRSYKAMADETMAQYRALVDAGYKFEFYPHDDPYPEGPRQAIADLTKNKHLYVFPTEGGFGTESWTTEHPLLADSGVTWGGRKVTLNDIFRAVHDVFGHGKEGVGFRADGEENAWRSHSAMYSLEARQAMTAETRGQNSVVNFGTHGEHNRTADQANTIYADQKAVVAPDWVVHEGAGDSLHSTEGQTILGSYRPQTGEMKLSSEHATPETMLHEALHAVRQSLAPGVQEIARRMYAPNGWDRAAEEHFVTDMLRVQHGETVSPEVQRLFTMTHEYLPGRGYVPMTVWEDAHTPHSPIASAVSKVVGEAKSPINSHFATGEATAQGLRRTDVGDAVTAHVQKLFRYFNTLDHRELAVNYGGETRLSSDDVLMRYDRRTPAGMKLPHQQVSSALKETLGILENKTGLPAPEQEGLAAGVGEALKDAVGHLFPRYGNDPELRRIDETAERGAQAPAGYVWVPKQMARLKDLEAAVTRGEPGKLGRFADNVNGAVTAATVYYKVGHIFTRVFTNAAANIMQGSAAPLQIARSVALSREIAPEEMTEALAYAGTHYFEAAPGATGSTVVGRGMQKGLHVPFTDIALRTKSGEAVMSPQWWAHNVDAPFRFNSIAYEARKAGYEGVDGFRQFLQDVREYNALETDGRARVDGVLRRADREAIAYDRLNQFEKRFLARAIWFYPWVKGSTVFTANTMLEHPFKAAALYHAGQVGSQEDQRQLGDMPSYAQGLTPWTHGAEPVVSDLNTFNPFGTAGDLLHTPEHLGNTAGMANPLYGAALNTAEGVNPYGSRTPTPITDNLKGLLSSAPEYQVAEAATSGGDQSHKLYPGGHGLNPLYKNWLGELVRALGGPAAPRHVNPLAGHSLAQRERTGR